MNDIGRKNQARTASTAPNISEIIAMAWDDDTSFDAIERAAGLCEKDVIKLMRANMKPSSFKVWRKRVSGRRAKHEAISYK